MTDFFPFQNNPKNLDPSYKMDLVVCDCSDPSYKVDLDFCHCFERENLIEEIWSSNTRSLLSKLTTNYTAMYFESQRHPKTLIIKFKNM